MSILSPELRRICEGAREIDSGRWKEGFALAWEGIIAALNFSDEHSGKDVLKAFSFFVGSLEDRLKKDFDLDVVPDEDDENDGEKDIPRCSHCSRKQDEAKVLIAGAGGLICDGCAQAFHDLVRTILAERESSSTDPNARKPSWRFEPNDVIARRLLDLRSTDGAESKVVIEIGRPRRFEDAKPDEEATTLLVGLAELISTKSFMLGG